MADVSVIGLGSMGSALAKALLAAGHCVTVWNRSPEKSQQLVSDGAAAPATIAEAVASSSIVIVCINNYASTMDLLGDDDVLPSLEGRVVVQMSSGTPQEAVQAEQSFADHSVGYLDSALLTSPKNIGTDEGQMLVAGNDGCWNESKSVLECLVGKLQYTGSKIDSAKILDLAWLCQRFGLFMGVFQGLLLCEAAGIEPKVFGSTIANDGRISLLARTIQDGSFNDPVNPIGVWHDALHHIETLARTSGINTEVLDFVSDKFGRAHAAGFENEDLAALIKVFK